MLAQCPGCLHYFEPTEDMEIKPVRGGKYFVKCPQKYCLHYAPVSTMWAKRVLSSLAKKGE